MRTMAKILIESDPERTIVKDLRIKAHIKPVDLAKEFNVERQTIHQVENRVHGANPDMTHKYCNKFNKKFDDLFEITK